MIRKLFALLVLLAVTAVPALAQDDVVYVRAAHLAIDAPLVDVYVNGDAVLTDVDFGDISGWLELSPGTYDVDVAPAGTSIDDAVVSGSYNLAAGDWATIAVIGLLGDDSLTMQALVEDLGNIADGETRISVLHAAPGVGAVNVLANDEALVNVLAYPGTLGADSDGFASVDVVADTYSIDVVDDESDTTALELGELVLGSNRAYFVAVVGIPSEPQFVLTTTDIAALTGEDGDDMAEMDTGTGAALARIGHFAAGAPEVDVYLDGDLVVGGLDFNEVTEYVEVTGGIYEVALVPADGDLSEAAYTGEIAIFEETVNLVGAIGLIENETLTVTVVEENNEPLAAGEARISFFQTIPSNNLFDLTLNDSILVQGVAYPEIFEGAGDGFATVDVIAARYDVGFQSDDDNIDVNVGNVTMGAGRHYLVVALGTTSDPLFVLISGDVVTVE
jgi:hypothetical protein